MLSRFGILVAAAGFVASASATAHVHHDVHRKLHTTGKVNIVVTMKETPARALRELESTTFETRGAKIEALVNRLDSHAAESQKEIDAIFAQEAAQRLYDVQDRSWALNARLIDGATIELVEKLAALPGVASIREQFVGKLAKPQVEAVNANATVKIEWGVDRIQAPSVWNQGNTGENIVVGILDTGVRWTHELIRSKMRETHNWYDPYNQSSLPLDVYGHGTHVTGTILGANGYGVAPGAKWIACLGCTTDACPERIMIKCGEFFTCPTDPKGLNKDCSKAPHVINNSWGSDAGRGDKAYQPMVDAWRAAGIIPVFSLGNDGSSCSTSYPPAEYANAIGVGATNSNNVLASFSSRGPAVSGIVKPDISAPGQSVTSGWRDSDTSLRSISGTSMAGPHVAGAVALLLSAQPNLTYDAIYSRLTKTANQTILKPTTGTRTCGGIPDTKFPNNHYGYGLLNVFSAVTTKA